MAIAEKSEGYIKKDFKNLSQCGEKMLPSEIAKRAEEYIKRYFWDIRKIELVKKSRGEFGFDIRNKSSTLFVEVKGSANTFKGLQGWYFTKKEYEKAQSCQRKETEYEIHLVVGIGSEFPEHYTVSGKVLLNQAEAEVSWYLSRRDLQDYDC